MFNKVIDVLQIRRIEKQIGRELQEKDIVVSDDTPEVRVQLLNGNWIQETIQFYSLIDLLPGNITEADLQKLYKEEYDIEQIKSKEVKKIPTPKGHGKKELAEWKAEFRLRRQEFNPDNGVYLGAVSDCIIEMDRQFETHHVSSSGIDECYRLTRTEDIIIRLHAEGVSDHAIARWLNTEYEKNKSKFQKLKKSESPVWYDRLAIRPYEHASVSRKVAKVLKGFGLKRPEKKSAKKTENTFVRKIIRRPVTRNHYEAV